jgi:hypothetical protein
MEDDLKKMKEDLNKNGRQPKKNLKMEDDLKRNQRNQP